MVTSKRFVGLMGCACLRGCETGGATCPRAQAVLRRAVTGFIDEKLRAAVDERAPNVRHGIAFQGQLLRTIGWLRSLAKLDDPGGDFQVITSAARSVFESAVDVTLMHFDGSANGPEKMDAWEDSAKLKHTQNVADYLSTLGRAPTDAERTMMAFATREKDRIEKLRLRWWSNENGRHPRNRWTGRDLGTDAKEADKLLPEGFEEFYRLRYPQLCWNVHGSGLAGVANVGPESFAYIGGQSLRRGRPVRDRRRQGRRAAPGPAGTRRTSSASPSRSKRRGSRSTWHTRRSAGRDDGVGPLELGAAPVLELDWEDGGLGRHRAVASRDASSPWEVASTKRLPWEWP